MTYRELLLQAELKLDHNDITLGEFEQMIAPLNREVDVLNKISTEIEEIVTYDGIYIDRAYVLEIIDKYIAESEK